MKPAILKDVSGKPIRCSNACCKRLARHIHHIQYRSEGGSDQPDNLQYLCEQCHVWLHSTAGDFRKWGQMGGSVTASTRKSFSNLKQFQGVQGRKRLQSYTREQR